MKNMLFPVPDHPLLPSAFEQTDEQKIATIAHHFKHIMETLGLDLTDDSLKGTPERVAKMYVTELFQGLNPQQKPSTLLFENRYQYNQMVAQKNISFYSSCEHHFVPIQGRAHVAYISNGYVVGLSKLNRIVQYFAKRPQVQERMTMQIGTELQNMLGTENVAVIIDAKHFCIASRGIQDDYSFTRTSFFEGRFKEDGYKKEFFHYVEVPHNNF